MGNPVKEYFRIRNYIVVPNLKCIPDKWKEIWYDDSEILVGEITIKDLLKLNGVSHKEYKSNISSIMVNNNPIEENFKFNKGLYKINYRKLCLNVWYCDYEHSFKDRVYSLVGI